MALAEEIFRRPSTDCVIWLLVATFIQFYNEKEESTQQKKCQFREMNQPFRELAAFQEEPIFVS